MVVGGPYSGGQSHPRQPLFSTCKMPLITRRSSTRSFPRTSVGKNGSILCHCSSFSQNKLLLMISAPISRAGNHYPIHPSSPLLSLDPSCGAQGSGEYRFRSKLEDLTMTKLARSHVWPEGHWSWPIKVTHKHGLRCGEMIFVGGQVALDPDGRVLAPNDLAAQIDITMA